MEQDMAIHKIKLKVGTVYQKEENGIYYFRYQVNGKRKAVSLGTRNRQQAIKEAEKYVPLIQHICCLYSFLTKSILLAYSEQFYIFLQRGYNYADQ